MQNPPRVFAKEYVDNTACYYYRIEVPMRGLNMYHKALVTNYGEWRLNTEEDFHTYLETLACQDVVQYYASGGPQTEAVIKFLTKLKPRHFIGGKLYPPIYITDLDDNIDYVHPLNFRFRQLGTRLPNGRLLRPGEDVNILMPDHTRVRIWQDGANEFNIKRNIKQIKSLHKCMKKAHGVTFTTERLQRYYKEKHGLFNTHVFPNSVIFDDYPSIKLRKKRGVIRMLFEGGQTHYPDWFPLKYALGVMMEKFPELEIVIFGPKYDWVIKDLPQDRIEWHNWVPYDAYKLKLATMDFDIMFAPLVRNLFNDYKSCIRFYEAAALPTPKPTLAANVPPYSDELIHGETAQMFEMPSAEDPHGKDFQEKLEHLIRDAKYRKELASNAKDWVRENRALDVTIGPYFEWLCKTKERADKAADGRLSRAQRKKNLRKPVRAKQAVPD